MKTKQKIPKFSIPEIEKRWKVDLNNIPDLKNLERYDIFDKYIPNTRTRLRKYLDCQKNCYTFKIEKKYGKISDFTEPRTGIYLTETEFKLFNQIQGYSLSKSRYFYMFNNIQFSLDIFA